MSGVDTIQTRGSNMYTDISSKFTWDQATRTIYISHFNRVPLGQREFIYFVVSTVINPGQTNPTASFTYKIYDPDNNQIEQVLDGITFTSTAGGFSVISVDANNKIINELGTQFTFTMRPQDTFNANAIIKITCPTQIKVGANS